MGRIVDMPYEQRKVIVIKKNSKKRSRAGKGLQNQFSMTSLVLGVGLDLLMDREDEASSKDLPKEVVSVSPEVAKKELTFPVGHPLEQNAYVAHPLFPERYYPIGEVDQTLFQEKVDEFLRLLASLGAKRVRINAKRGYKSNKSAHANMSLDGVGVGVEGDASSQERHESEWEEHFKGKTPPSIPKGLVWFKKERAWQELARRRIDLGTTRSRTSLTYEASYGVDSKLKISLAEMGFGVGVSSKEFESTEWNFDVEFVS